MRLGVHLPLADLGQGLPDAEQLRRYTATAAELGFDLVSANDHLVWKAPWLDGPTALASVLGSTAGMALATSVALPVVRHPVVLAKALGSLAALARGPVIVGLGPGSSAADHRAVGLPFEERWGRFDEAAALVRALLRGEAAPEGSWYPGAGLRLDPVPSPAPEVWWGTWGSDRRLRRLARTADGWLASAYNTTPARHVEARARLDEHLRAAGRDPGAFPDMVATAWLHVTDSAEEAAEVATRTLAPLLGREPEQLLARLPVGSAEHCAELLDAYARTGTRRVLLWPVRDPVDQLRAVAEEVLPRLASHP